MQLRNALVTLRLRKREKVMPAKKRQPSDLAEAAAQAPQPRETANASGKATGSKGKVRRGRVLGTLACHVCKARFKKEDKFVKVRRVGTLWVCNDC